jgi:hypothetical protein
VYSLLTVTPRTWLNGNTKKFTHYELRVKKQKKDVKTREKLKIKTNWKLTHKLGQNYPLFAYKMKTADTFALSGVKTEK